MISIWWRDGSPATVGQSQDADLLDQRVTSVVLARHHQLDHRW
jgi:hypothetical protein